MAIVYDALRDAGVSEDKAKHATQALALSEQRFAAIGRADFAEAIAVLTPLAKQCERIGGSRAQHDLIEFTLLKACLNAGRLEEAQQVLSARRSGACGVPVKGVEAVH